MNQWIGFTRVFFYFALFGIFAPWQLNASSKSSVLDWNKLWSVPDWSEQASLPVDGNRANIYQLDEATFNEVVRAGRLHALHYPVTDQKVAIPFRPLKNFFEAGEHNPLKQFVLKIMKRSTGWSSFQDMWDYLDFHDYPLDEGKGAYFIPFKNGIRPEYPMGVTLQHTQEAGTIMTYGCAACHSGNLFGRPILGLTKRFPRANDYFLQGKKYAPLVPDAMFRLGTGANAGETRQFGKMKHALAYIEGIAPQALGLDTSLAHTGLSLTHRDSDPYATRNPKLAYNPKPSELRKTHTDSKPAVWWTMKYKTKFLSDGSVVSGNPIFTNFLWNEIGRGQDLVSLEKWLNQNKQTIIELTAAVFATESPKFIDFFGANAIDIEMAKRGEVLFKDSCQRCHGEYQKGWALPNAKLLTPEELLATVKVNYPRQTKIKNVGTSSLRREGMRYFLDGLNGLKIAKDSGTLVREQQGYIPPALDGIWARWPYFHNNSVPSLCAILTPDYARPKTFWMGESNDENRDFDRHCNGYPLGAETPVEWKQDREYLFDTTKVGLSNQGHTQEILLNEDGAYKFTKQDVRDLVSFLQTL